MSKKEINKLYKALHVLFYDQGVSSDLEVSEDEEEYIECTVGLLVARNGDICPFKNYSCECNCSKHKEKCLEGLKCDCDRDIEDVWKEFINNIDN